MTEDFSRNASGAAHAEEPVQPMLQKHLEILVDPADHARLALDSGVLRSLHTGAAVPVRAGIPLFAPVSETAPASWPAYEGLESRQNLRQKLESDAFSRLLDEQIPQGALVWEAGCASGQLGNFLGMSWRRNVIATDSALAALVLGKQFADRNVVRNIGFVQAETVRPPFRESVFDLAIFHGERLAPSDQEEAFACVVSRLKPGGFVIAGRGNPTSQVLQWFGRCGVDFLNGIPHVDGSGWRPQERLFEPRAAGSRTARLGARINQIMAGGKNRDLFVTIGRKR